MTHARKAAFFFLVILLAACSIPRDFPLEPESTHDAALFGIKRGNKWIVEPQYENSFEVVPGGWYAWVEQEGWWGLINTSGKELVACTCDQYWEMTDDVYMARSGGKYAIISTRFPAVVTPFCYDSIYFAGGEGDYNCLIARCDGKYGVISLRAKEAIPVQYDSVSYTYSECDENLFGVQQNGKWGLMNSRNGRQLVEPRYDSIAGTYYDCDRIVLYLNRTLTCIDEKGERQKLSMAEREDCGRRWSGDFELR